MYALIWECVETCNSQNKSISEVLYKFNAFYKGKGVELYYAELGPGLKSLLNYFYYDSISSKETIKIAG